MYLTDEQIQELFQQLNMTVPHLVMGGYPTAWDCDQVRQALAVVTYSTEEQVMNNLRDHMMTQFPNADMSEGSVFHGLMSSWASQIAPLQRAQEALMREHTWPYKTEADPPPTPTAEELMVPLREHPEIMITLLGLLAKELNYTCIGQGQRKFPTSRQVIDDVVGRGADDGE